MSPLPTVAAQLAEREAGRRADLAHGAGVVLGCVTSRWPGWEGASVLFQRWG
jgi:hypothetical protein